MSIWGNTLVKNEERYLWFAVISVIDYLDRLLIWDTGSKDNTVEIVKDLQKKYPDKIEFKEVGEVDITGFTKARQQMLEKTKGDWLLILDGDEVWWEDSIKEIVGIIDEKGKEIETIVSPMVNIVGDIYHYQEEKAGGYKIDDRVGHLTIRAMNMAIPGLHVDKPHGTQGFFDGSGKLIQERSAKRRLHAKGKIMHFTHMTRSYKAKDKDVPKRARKYKYEIGEEFPLDFYYPEAFFKEKPDYIKSPWQRMENEYLLKATVQTPLRKIKRRVLKSGVGY